MPVGIATRGKSKKRGRRRLRVVRPGFAKLPDRPSRSFRALSREMLSRDTTHTHAHTRTHACTHVPHITQHSLTDSALTTHVCGVSTHTPTEPQERPLAAATARSRTPPPTRALSLHMSRKCEGAVPTVAGVCESAATCRHHLCVYQTNLRPVLRISLQDDRCHLL